MQERLAQPVVTGDDVESVAELDRQFIARPDITQI
jgi:hypothetical protein